MKSTGSKLFFALLFLLFSLSLPAQTVTDARSYVPALNSNESIEDYLSFLRNTVPQAFAAGVYFVDPRRTVEKEQFFLSKINNPEFTSLYLQELQPRKPFQTVQFNLKEEVLKPVPQFKPGAAEELATRLAEHTAAYPTEEAQMSALRDWLTATKGQTSQGLATGMIQSMPKEQKAAAFALDFEAKLQYLQEHLSQEALRANFKSNIFDKDTLTVEGLIGEIRQLALLERQVAEMSLLIYTRKLNAKLDLAHVQNFDLHKDKSFLTSLDPDGKIKAKDIIQGAMSSLTRKNIENAQVPVLEIKGTYAIEELSPHLGQFRGTINNDCFTTMAFGFAYSPAERTFVLKDSAGNIMFSIYAIDVLMNGVRSLYVHDMGRADVSPLMAEHVMRALYSARTELGFEQIAVSTKGMHYYQFKNAVDNANSNSEVSEVTILDPRSREVIGNLMVEINGPDISKAGLDPSYAKSHDLPQSHSHAVVFVPKENPSHAVQVTSVKPQKTAVYQPSSQLPLSFSPKLSAGTALVLVRKNRCSALFH